MDLLKFTTPTLLYYFMEKDLNVGTSYERSEIPDIAPTLAAMLGIAFPNGTTGKPLTQVLE
jgi:bisphosphoglycerate-independent phosphoglycerate mutase (AlkP superfamily)